MGKWTVKLPSNSPVAQREEEDSQGASSITLDEEAHICRPNEHRVCNVPPSNDMNAFGCSAVILLSIYGLIWLFFFDSFSSNEALSSHSMDIDIVEVGTQHLGSVKEGIKDMQFSQDLNFSQICIIIPVTSKQQNWETIHESFLIRWPFPSIQKTVQIHQFSYSIYVGYDVGDAFYDNQTTLIALSAWAVTEFPFAKLKIRSFENTQRKPVPAMNFLFQEAYKDHCDFMYRINDDTELLTTSWSSTFVETLKSFTPALLGVVGPTCHQGNQQILTHNFVHRSHFDIFSWLYPPELSDGFNDAWISNVYGNANTKKLENVEVLHHQVPRRFRVSKQNQKLVGTLVLQGHDAIAKISRAKIISYSLFSVQTSLIVGAQANADLISKNFPGWTMRVYHDESISLGVLNSLRSAGVQLVNMTGDSIKNKAMWRFLPAGETMVQRFLSRDLESRLTAREAAAVREWEDSGLPFHVMRDHPKHLNKFVLGSLWGSVGGAVKDMRQRLEQKRWSRKGFGEVRFMNKQVWPLMMAQGVLVHDAFSCDRNKTRPFPTAREGSEYVGGQFLNASTAQADADAVSLFQALASDNFRCQTVVSNATWHVDQPVMFGLAGGRNLSSAAASWKKKGQGGKRTQGLGPKAKRKAAGGGGQKGGPKTGGQKGPAAGQKKGSEADSGNRTKQGLGGAGKKGAGAGGKPGSQTSGPRPRQKKSRRM